MNASPDEALREGAIVLGDPDGGRDVEPRVRPREHAGGLVLVKQRQANKQPEHARVSAYADALR